MSACDASVLTEGAGLTKPGLDIFALAVGVYIAEVSLEEFGASVFAVLSVECCGIKRANHIDACAGAGHGDIESFFPSFLANGAKACADRAARLVWTIGDGENDQITLVALDVFEVSDKEAVCEGAFAINTLDLGCARIDLAVLAPEAFYQVALFGVEGDHTH